MKKENERCILWKIFWQVQHVLAINTSMLKNFKPRLSGCFLPEHRTE
jgi:hypothetical protein